MNHHHHHHHHHHHPDSDPDPHQPPISQQRELLFATTSQLGISLYHCRLHPLVALR